MPESGTFGSGPRWVVDRPSDQRLSARAKEATMPDLVRLGFAVVVFAHGVGHLLFLAPVIGLGNWAEQTGESWVLTGAIGEGATRVIATVLWSAAIVLFVAGVGGFLGATEWWRPVTIAAAGLSIL